MARRVEEDSGIDVARLRVLARGLLAVAPAGRWWPYGDPFEVAVSAVLTQRARWGGAARAMEELRGAGLLTPSALEGAPRARVERCVRPAGFYRQKARALQEIAARICDGFGGDWKKLARLPTDQLREEVLSWRGVGEETADAIMLYALGRSAFVVDAYALRLMRRFGALAPEAEPSYGEVASAWRAVAKSRVGTSKALHGAIVDFCKSTCAARPHCGQCPLEPSCAKVNVKAASL
jgi:endonuclease III related protein